MWGKQLVSPNKNKKNYKNTLSKYLQLIANFFGNPRVSQLKMAFISRIEASIPETKDKFN